MTPIFLILGLLASLFSSAVAVKGKGPRGLSAKNNAFPLVLQDTSVRRFLDDSDEKKGRKAPSKRECNFKQKKGTVEFKCKAKTTTTDDESDDETEIKDEIKFKVEAKDDEPLYLQIDYKQEIEIEINDVEMENETKTSFAVEFERLVEYRKVTTDVAVEARVVDGDNSTADVAETSAAQDDDESEAFDWVEDQVVSEYIFTEWSDFSDVQEDNETATFSIGTPDGIVTFMFTIAKADLGKINANKMKVDFDLDGFPWTANDTYVALITAVESKRKIKVEYDNEPKKKKKTKDVKISFDDALEDIGFTPFGSYTWAETAVAWDENTTDTNTTNTTSMTNSTENDDDDDSGTDISVIATSPPDDDGSSSTTTITYLSFSFVGSAAQGAREIYWDPEAGIGYAGLDTQSSATSMNYVGWTSCVLFAHWMALFMLL